MRQTTLKRVYMTLRQGWNKLSPESQRALRNFVKSQRTKHGYMNPGGHEDPYYHQFGKVLESVFSIWKLPFFDPSFVIDESVGKDDIYGKFIDFLSKENPFRKIEPIELNMPARLSTNKVCCILVMQHQTGCEPDAKLLKWLRDRQDETGGFHASKQAPIPDMLSTAVSLFTLKLVDKEYQKVGNQTIQSTIDFIQAHWLDSGGFAPTILDDYSDVEYCFYGLLALGSIVTPE